MFAGGGGFLEHRAIRFIARISYAIYLYHPIALSYTGLIPVRHAQRILTIPLILAMATASYYLIERPFMRMRDRK